MSYFRASKVVYEDYNSNEVVSYIHEEDFFKFKDIIKYIYHKLIEFIFIFPEYSLEDIYFAVKFTDNKQPIIHYNFKNFHYEFFKVKNNNEISNIEICVYEKSNIRNIRNILKLWKIEKFEL